MVNRRAGDASGPEGFLPKVNRAPGKVRLQHCYRAQGVDCSGMSYLPTRDVYRPHGL